MRPKSMILVITLAIIGVSMALKGSLIAGSLTSVDIQKGTEAIGKFLDCVNDKIKTKGAIDISDTVECLEDCCTATLTMSEDSAQAACFLGGANGTGTCQLPRVILKCPGPPQMELSYLLCGTGSAGADNVIGGNRVEIGVVVGETGSGTVMVMADVPVPPGTSNNIENVISVGTATSRGTKGCNACHGDAGMKANVGEPQLSERIEAFGTIDDPQNARNPSFIIDTDDCQVQEKINGLPLGNLNGVGVKKQTLAEICDCIDMAAIGGTVTAQVKNLCQELENYQKNRGISSGTCTPCISPAPTPSPTGTPTAITLAYFSAKAGKNGSVILTWETVTEVGNAGFNLYRAKTENGEYKKINDTFIPAQGNAVSGASYSYADMPGRGAFYYKLEDVDETGVNAMHGPEKVRVKSGTGNNVLHRSKKARR
ncbi:MAG: hypothetical protein DYG83_12235 [Candidatus Brocadia sp. AMX2]|uniref:Cytochrome c domain-containing protein n=1 Tax=Candidatus Brocadia sinica JPN1 TaxID=1197129 RepID=A0ABQ0JU35_9BACT|nr:MULTISPECIES: hypothetical protein [Brocadia]MBC6933225.1 hypothetical protein [Candidatus Brocadia sp.]MBL1168940.1 hypothetical protein [Candidatus Brocadia sp. AMX1]NOG41893.1 hypothetical protein [Planctomycetota bacterium]GIK14992.1 MAG: hypothetical protein BroJett002_36990 [Candidatus Brocadia sinica]KAA0241764.1 MAG: hypothetical protein EDM70_16730 [Candidatus Brocadia sp. AMX2]